MHKLFIDKYSYFLKKEINIKSNRSLDDINYFIKDTINNLPTHIKIAINILGFIIFFSLRLNFFKFELFLKLFENLLFFKKYILFIKVLILTSLNDT